MYIVLCNYCKANSVSLAPAENLRADNNRCNFDLASANTELSSEKNNIIRPNKTQANNQI